MKLSRELLEYRIENLSRLLDVLNRPLPEGAVHDQGTFGRHKGDHDPGERNHCGTTACALGWFALSREGRACGLKHEWHITDKDNSAWLEITMAKRRARSNPLASEIKAMWLTYDPLAEVDRDEFAAAGVALGLSEGESDSLFSGQGTRETVRVKVRRMIANNKKAYDEVR